MNDETLVTLGEVRAACDTLLEVIGRECDREAATACYWMAEDVLAILRGEWTAETAGGGRVKS